jgi:hypothetical protein
MTAVWSAAGGFCLEMTVMGLSAGAAAAAWQ